MKEPETIDAEVLPRERESRCQTQWTRGTFGDWFFVGSLLAVALAVAIAGAVVAAWIIYQAFSWAGGLFAV